MANITAPEVNAIQFPEQPVYVGTPKDFYTQIVVPQTRPDLPLVYLPGFITTGGAINIEWLKTDIGRVIQENSRFAVTFWNCLLSSPQPLYIPEVGHLGQAQLFSPHAINRCALPEEVGQKSPNYWGEYQFYAMQFAWIFGLQPELFTDFSAAMLADVNLPLLKNHYGDHDEREQETFKIVKNMDRYFKNGNKMKPIDAMVALPNPHHDKVQSIGTGLELKVSQHFHIPSYQTVIHPEEAHNDLFFAPAWNTVVGSWMLQQLVNLPEQKNPTGYPVSVKRRKH